MTTKNDVWRQIEKGLGSVGRLKILRALSSGEAISQTKYRLERTTRLKPVDVRKHLKVLIDAGWVNEHDYNPPVYTLNNDPKTKLFVEYLERIGCL